MNAGRSWAPGHETEGEEENLSAHGDLMHDPWLSCQGPQLKHIAAEIIDRCERLHTITGRKPRRDAVERRGKIVGNLVANLAALTVGQLDAEGVAVSTKNNAIIRYDRKGFSPEVVSTCLLTMETLGLISRRAGIRNGARTSIGPSTQLRTQLLALVTPDQVGREPGSETIILRAGGQLRGHTKPLVNYTDTPQTHLLRAEMSRINARLNDRSVTVDDVQVAPIQLTRRFQIASPNAPHTFDQHGRIYGGFWINMHRAERHRIRVQGEELADLDFTAMFTQLAYLEAGLSLPEGDPYAGLSGLDGNTDPELAARQRDAIKRGLNAFFFRTGRMERLPSEVKRLLGHGWTATKFAAAVRTRHAPIKHLFGTGIGIRFMFTESQILVRTLLDLLDVGIPALPIHDGIMVPRSGQLRALEAMRNASAAVTGWELPVKAKQL